MQTKTINKILKPVYYYLLMILIYYLVVGNSVAIETSDITLYVGIFIFLIYPFILLFQIIKRKKYLFKHDSYKSTFFFSLIPGFIFGNFISYGFYGMAHKQGFIDFIKVTIYYVPLFSIISGLLGILIDFIWNKIQKIKKQDSGKL